MAGDARSAQEVRNDIERTRTQIASSALALKQEVDAKTDWREWIRSRPAQWILGAFVVGWWLGNRRR